MQVPVFLVLKTAYLFTAAESSDLEVSCLSAFWVLLLVSQCSFSHRLASPFGGLIPSISIKTMLYPNITP